MQQIATLSSGRTVWTGLSSETRPTHSLNGEVIVPGSELFLTDAGKEEYFGTTTGWVQTHDASGAALVEQGQAANEQGVNTLAQIGVSIPKCNATPVDVSTNSTSVSLGAKAQLLGVYVNTAIATEAVTLRNGAGGTVLYTIPIGAVAGQKYEYNGAQFSLGIFVESTSATGNITVEWWQQP